MSIAEIAACSTRPPSKYWLRYISCHSDADQECIATDKKLAKVLDRADDRALATREAAFAPTEKSLVSLDLHD